MADSDVPGAVELSVVTPLFNEEALVEEFLSRLKSVLEGTGRSWEAILVNDGSRDRTGAILEAASLRDPRLKVLELTRNFGHQMAITAGLRRSIGRAVIVMDGDFQDPPELIPEMLEHWKKGAEVVLALRRSRAEKGLRRLCFSLFYRVLDALSDLNPSVSSGVFCLMDRRAVDALDDFSEHNRYFPGLRSWAGFHSEAVYFDRPDRPKGEPKQTFLRLLRYGLDAVFSFSYKPLRIASLCGVVVWLLTGLYALVLVCCRLANIYVVPGFTTTSVTVLLLGGLQLLCLGILGEYLARIYDEVKRRPLFIERNFRSGAKIERPRDTKPSGG